MPTIEASITVRCDINDAFDFLTRTENIPKIVPPDLKLSLLQAPDQLAAGSRFEVQILGFGPTQNVIYEIGDFAPPNGFTETQVKGPLKRYVHEHRLEQQQGGVLMTDRIDFDPPGGLLGILVTAERLRSSFEKGLAHRHQAIKQLLETR